MKLIRFTSDDSSEVKPGIQDGSTVLDLTQGGFSSFRDVLKSLQNDKKQFTNTVDTTLDSDGEFDIDDVSLHAPVDENARIICLGGVFPSHLRDRGDDLNMVPSQWLVPDPAIVGPDDPIQLSTRVVEDTKPAVELGVVIGTGGRYLRQSEAYNHIAGYTIVNDVTARTDWPGPMAYKLMDTFSPCGPHVVTRDQISDPHNLSMRILQDGNEICSGSTAGMRFTIPYLVSFLSTIIELKPGDVISTGDPAGVEASLSVGSTVKAEIQDIGVLSNPIIIK